MALFYCKNKDEIEIDQGTQVKVDPKTKNGRLLYLYCEKISIEDYLRDTFSIELWNQDKETVQFNLIDEEHLGHAVKYEVSLKERGVLQFLIKNQSHSFKSVWFKAGSYDVGARNEFRVLKRTTTVKCSLNVIKEQKPKETVKEKPKKTLKEKMKSWAAKYSKLRYWASLAANAIVLHEFSQNQPPVVNQTFFLHILKEISGRTKKETQASMKWKQIINQSGIPAQPKCQNIDMLKDLSTQMHANYIVHILRLKERLGYNLARVKGVEYVNSLVENIFNGSTPPIDQVG